MILREALRRLAVTVPFLVLAAVLLGFFGRTTLPPRYGPDGTALVLIVTTPSLSPAFQALRAWSDEQGCPTLMLTLDSESSLGSSQGWVRSLGPYCNSKGVTGLLLGGDRDLLPALGDQEGASSPPGHLDRQLFEPRLVAVPYPSDGTLPEGLLMGRALVNDISQAWAFVEACRGSGQTLPQLLDGTQMRAHRETASREAFLARALAPRRP